MKLERDSKTAQEVRLLNQQSQRQLTVQLQLKTLHKPKIDQDLIIDESFLTTIILIMMDLLHP